MTDSVKHSSLLRQLIIATTLSIKTFSLTVRKYETQHIGIEFFCWVLLCSVSQLSPLFWVSLCWVECRLCWVSKLSLLCWVSLCWMSQCCISLCWVSKLSHYAECYYAECHNAVCYTECLGGIKLRPQKVLLCRTSGLYYKHILTIVSDDRKWRQYYKCNWRC